MYSLSPPSTVNSHPRTKYRVLRAIKPIDWGTLTKNEQLLIEASANATAFLLTPSSGPKLGTEVIIPHGKATFTLIPGWIAYSEEEELEFSNYINSCGAASAPQNQKKFDAWYSHWQRSTWGHDGLCRLCERRYPDDYGYVEEVSVKVKHGDSLPMKEQSVKTARTKTYGNTHNGSGCYTGQGVQYYRRPEATNLKQLAENTDENFGKDVMDEG